MTNLDVSLILHPNVRFSANLTPHPCLHASLYIYSPATLLTSIYFKDEPTLRRLRDALTEVLEGVPLPETDA